MVTEELFKGLTALTDNLKFMFPACCFHGVTMVWSLINTQIIYVMVGRSCQTCRQKDIRDKSDLITVNGRDVLSHRSDEFPVSRVIDLSRSKRVGTGIITKHCGQWGVQLLLKMQKCGLKTDGNATVSNVSEDMNKEFMSAVIYCSLFAL